MGNFKTKDESRSGRKDQVNGKKIEFFGGNQSNMLNIFATLQCVFDFSVFFWNEIKREVNEYKMKTCALITPLRKL